MLSVICAGTKTIWVCSSVRGARNTVPKRARNQDLLESNEVSLGVAYGSLKKLDKQS